MTGMTDGAGSHSVSYDDLDNVVSHSVTYTGLSAKSVSYTFNADGSRASMTTPAGTTTYGYDAGGRMTSLTNPNSETTSWTYLDNDWLKTQTLHNTVTTTWTYNALGQPTDLHTRKGTGAMDPLLASYTSMAHDGAGNRTSLSATVTGATNLSGSTAWTYDTKEQLTQEASARNGSYTHNFGYDSAGNPTTFKGASQSFNGNNQNAAYTFDGNGNPTTYKGTSCSYDVENRMTAYGSALTNGYRGDGLRAWKQPSGGSKTYFLYDGELLACELDSSGNVSAYPTFGPAGLVSRRSGSTTTYMHFDPQGGLSQTTDGSGNVTASYAWDAYGSALNGSAGVYGYGAQWGYYTDAETGLQLCTYRMYDLVVGRFVTRDPIGYSGGVNLYGYVGNGPTGAVDPLGLAELRVAYPTLWFEFYGYHHAYLKLDSPCTVSATYRSVSGRLVPQGTLHGTSIGMWESGLSMPDDSDVAGDGYYPLIDESNGGIVKGKGDNPALNFIWGYPYYGRRNTDPAFDRALCRCISSPLGRYAPRAGQGYNNCLTWAWDMWRCAQREVAKSGRPRSR
jgi:RHS repeat-associated protein